MYEAKSRYLLNSFIQVVLTLDLSLCSHLKTPQYSQFRMQFSNTLAPDIIFIFCLQKSCLSYMTHYTCTNKTPLKYFQKTNPEMVSEMEDKICLSTFVLQNECQPYYHLFCLDKTPPVENVYRRAHDTKSVPLGFNRQKSHETGRRRAAVSRLR